MSIPSRASSAVMSQAIPAFTYAEVWKTLRHLESAYREWKTAFVALSTSAPEPLIQTFVAQKVHWQVVDDPSRRALHVLNARATPVVLLFDEWGYLRYRGPVDKAEAALRTIIGRIESVNEPEPPVEGGCVR